MEFDGYLTGIAEKHFFKRSRILGQKIILWSALLIAPSVLSFAIRLKVWSAVAIFVGLFMCIMLFVSIPQSKKGRTQITPKKIVIEHDYIVCVAEKYTETRLVSDVKLVKDFGEYYELCFPFGKLSDKFVCQKSLLTKGTIQEFERLFNGKIVRQNGTGDGSVCSPEQTNDP